MSLVSGWPTRLPVAVAAVALVLTAACGGSPGRSVAAHSSDESEPATTVTAPETTTTTTLNQGKYGFEPKYQWTWTTRTPNGYAQSGSLSIGTVSRVDQAPKLKSFSEPSSILRVCSKFDPATTGVVPMALELRNDSDGFPLKLSQTIYRGYRAGQLQALSPLLVARTYSSSGVECDEVSTAEDAFFSHGSGWGLSFNTPTAPGVSETPHIGYALIPNYFSPAAPDGNADLLDDALLTVVPNMSTDERQLTAFSGSGIPADYIESSKGSLLKMAVIPIDGTLPVKR